MVEVDAQLEHFITNKWKVAYDDLSLESRTRGKDAASTEGREDATSTEGRKDDMPTEGRKDATTTEGRKDVMPSYGFTGPVPSKIIENHNSIHNWNRSTTGGAPKKSQSVPPPTSRPMDCLDCPVDVTEVELCACGANRKRKEPQDTLHEHDRKFSRSCSLELEREDLRFLRTFTLVEEEEVTDLDNNVVVPFKEVTQELNEKQNQLEALDSLTLTTADGGKRRTRRRKRHRRDSSAEYKENKEKTVEKETSTQTTQHSEEPIRDEFHRKNALNFLYDRPGPVSRRSSSPLPAESPVRSPPALSKRSSSIGEVEAGGGCWVSQRLAHIIAVETPKQTMNLDDNESPRTLNLINSNRFVEMNGHLENRSSDSEKTPRLKQLTKQLSNLKKKIEALEATFQEANGYRPSHQDKVNNVEMKDLTSEYSKLKRIIKNEKENNNVEDKTDSSRKNSVSPAVKSIELIEAKRVEILKRLDESRTSKNRPADVMEMSLDHILEEKLEMHFLLREYEKEFGHPESKDEKEMMKEVYERYRIIKRMARRSSLGKSGDSVGDLITIPEDDEVDLTLLTPAHRINLNVTSHVTSRVPQVFSRHAMDLPDFLEKEISGEPSKLWHAMTRGELLKTFKQVREEKKIARRAVKEFEDRFSTLTGRKVTKEDREPLEKTYQVYKTSKSKLKLINALLSKSEDKDNRYERYDR